ncbi:MAG: hypothetical protein JO360_18005 [Acidobacteria bacterium]|nr:hypothetical protein [Acidobacteriota bacterium]
MLQLEWTIKLKLGSEPERESVTMAKWIKEQSELFRRERVRQERRVAVLPDKASQLWIALRTHIQESVDEINNDSEFQSRVRGILQFKASTDSDAFSVSKQTPPEKNLYVSFNKDVPILTARLYTGHPSSPNVASKDFPPINFELDDGENVFLKMGEVQVKDLDELSKIWLMQFVSP